MGGCLSFLGGRQVDSAELKASLMAIKQGSLDDRYEQLKELGKGAGGVAILVRDKTTGKLSVAKKAIHDCSQGRHSHNHSNEDDFLREIQVMKGMSHINILSTVGHLQSMEWCDTTQAPVRVNYVFTEFAEGGDLAAYLTKVYQSAGSRSSGIPERMLAQMLLQPLLGTAYLHGKSLVHNDIKPENVLVMDKLDLHALHRVPRCVLTDFGNVLYANETTLASFGDPRYRAPEAWDCDYNDTEIFDSRSLDVWSFGVMIFELLSGGKIPYLYEHVTLEQISEDKLFDKLAKEMLKGDEVDLSHCRTGSVDAKDVLQKTLIRDTSSRTTVSALVMHKWFATDPTGQKETTAFLDDSCLRMLALHESKTQVHTAFQNVLARSLSGHHKQECQKVFAKADENRDGTLDRNEFRKALASMRGGASSSESGEATYTDAEADKLFLKADLDGDNNLTVDEFVAVTFNWNSMSQAQINRHLEAVIREWGSDDDGYLTYEDLLERLKAFVSENTLQSVFKTMDLDGDGRLSRDELNEFLFGLEVHLWAQPTKPPSLPCSCLEFCKQRCRGGARSALTRVHSGGAPRMKRCHTGNSSPPTSPLV